jgi:hypothetical protein
MAKDNSLYLRKNKDQKSESHPGYKGSGVVFGKEVWIDAWLNTDDQTKEKYFAIKVKEKAQQGPPKREPGSDDDFKDDIPF